MVRELTAGEKTAYRRAGQWGEVWAAIHRPATVFTARVNQVFSSWNGVARVTYDGGVGTLADVLAGMTLYVGSAAGRWDKGRCRIRKAPSSLYFFVGEVSNIQWADNDFLTVVDEHGLWEKHPTISGTISYMDYDLAYTNQHLNFDPIVRMGPQAWVGWLSAGDVVFSPDASGSSVFDSTISSYVWSAPGAASTSGMTTATPTIHYSAAGQYRVSCQVTAATGKTMMGHRRVFVFDADHLPDRVAIETAPSGSIDGGWAFDIRMVDGATDIRPSALVTLFSRDYDETGSVARACPYAGYENIIAIGWVSKVRTRQNVLDGGDVVVEVQGANWWMNRLPGFTAGIEYSSAASAWTQMTGLTVDRGLWHLFHWRSTLDAIMDVRLSGDTKLAASLEAAGGSFASQLAAYIEDTIVGSVRVDRFGCLYAQVDAQYIPEADRGDIPTVLVLEAGDGQGELNWEEELVQACSMLETSGVSYNGSAATAIFSAAPGGVMSEFGSAESIDNLLFSSQAQANELCGLIFAKLNNRWPSIPIITAGDLRMVDITPRQYLQITVAAADTLRGFDLTLRLIPRAVRFRMSETGEITQELDCEGEIFAAPSVTVEPPATPNYNVPNQPNYDDTPTLVPLPDLPAIDIPDWVPGDAGLPGLVCRNDNGYSGNGPFKLWPGNSSIVSGFYTSGMLESWVRRAAATYKTQVVLDGYFEVANSTSGPWAPQTDDTIPCEIIPNNGLFADMSSAYITYSWDLRPSQNGGHGILRATFSPPDGFNAAYYYVKVGSSVFISDTIELVGVPESIFNPGSSQAAFEMLSGIRRYAMNPPCSTSSTYWLNSQGHAAFRIVNDVNRGYGRINLYWKNTQLNANDGEFPTHAFANLREHPNTLYRPYLLQGGVNAWFEGSYYELTGSNSVDRTWNAGTEYITIEEGVFNIYGMAHVNWKNGWMWEITKLGWQPYSGGAFGTEQVLFGNSQRYNRVTINSMNVYNVCARE